MGSVAADRETLKFLHVKCKNLICPYYVAMEVSFIFMRVVVVMMEAHEGTCIEKIWNKVPCLHKVGELYKSWLKIWTTILRNYFEQNVFNKWKESYYSAVFTNRKHIFPFLGRLQYIQCAVWVFIWAAVVAVASAKQSAWHQTQAFWVQFLEGFGMSDGDSDLALKCAISLQVGSWKER